MIPNLNLIIEQVGKEKGISKEVLIEVLESAMLIAVRKKLGPHRDLEAHYNDDLGEIEVFEFKTVVDVIENEHLEILMPEAVDLDSESQVGDSLGMKIDSRDFGRIAAQTAKQIIIQKLRDVERDNTYMEFKDRRGELITGIARRFERGGDVIVDIGKAEAVLPKREQSTRESYRAGDRVQAYLVDVQKAARGPQIILSRKHEGLLIKLFEAEVPEIYESIVSIVSAAREAGSRSKIAVASRDNDVDPVGACVGMKGARVQAVVQELRNEKIDIVPHDDEPARFVCNALAPAEVSRVLVDETNHQMEIIVPDDQLSLAIGRNGQNVRLAAQLTGWRIDLISESDNKDIRELAWKSLGKLEGISETQIEMLYNYKIRKAQEVFDIPIEELVEIPGFSKEFAMLLKTSAEKVLKQEREMGDGEQIELEVDVQRNSIIEKLHKNILNDRERLLLVRGVGEKTIVQLRLGGYHTVEDILKEEDLDHLATSTGIGIKKARQIHHSSKVYLDKEAGLRVLKETGELKVEYDKILKRKEEIVKEAEKIEKSEESIQSTAEEKTVDKSEPEALIKPDENNTTDRIVEPNLVNEDVQLV